MNKNIVSGKWEEIKGKVKEQWGKLTDDDMKQVEGNFQKLKGVIQQRYGHKEEEAQREIDAFKKMHEID